jgi:hypothetical protein
VNDGNVPAATILMTATQTNELLATYDTRLSYDAYVADMEIRDGMDGIGRWREG